MAQVSREVPRPSIVAPDVAVPPVILDKVEEEVPVVRLANEFNYDAEDRDAATLLSNQAVFAIKTDDVKYVVCPLPKVGSSYHIGLMLRAIGVNDYENFSVIHDLDRKASLDVTRLGHGGIMEWYRDINVPKYVVVRNPMVRVLSAYLDKIERHLPEGEKNVASFEKWLAKEFSPGLWANGRILDEAQRIDPHWRPQSYFCGFRTRSLASPFKRFKFEDPAPIVEYLYKLIPSRLLADGWGRGKDISMRDYMLAPKTRTSGTEDKMSTYFANITIFDQIVNELRFDIDLFGYTKDVDELREEIKLKSLEIR